MTKIFSKNKFTDKSLKYNNLLNLSLTDYNINNLKYNKKFPSSNKEWKNSVYLYNKNYIKLIPVYNKIIYEIILSYFNFINFNLEYSKLRNKKVYLKDKRLSSNKVYVSRTKSRFTNNKAILDYKIFNVWKKLIINEFKLNINDRSKIKSLQVIKSKYRSLDATVYRLIKLISANKNLNTIERFMSIKLLNYMRNIKTISFSSKDLNNIKKVSLKYSSKISYLKSNIYNNYFSFINSITDKKISLEKSYLINEVKQFLFNNTQSILDKCFEEEKLMLFYKRLMMYDNCKYNDMHISNLKDLISKFYNKETFFNFTNLRYYFLNSDILADTITTKLNNRKNKPTRIIKKSLQEIVLPSVNKHIFITDVKGSRRLLSKQQIKQLKLYKKIYSKDLINQYIENLHFKHNVKDQIMKNIESKFIQGIQVEASGRLSKRLTAARSVFKLRRKGGLSNVNSSLRGLSNVLLRNYSKSNIEYTNVNSKTRNGSFGLKIWISGR